MNIAFQNGQKWFKKINSKLLNISEVLSLRNLIQINKMKKIKYAKKGPAYSVHRQWENIYTTPVVNSVLIYYVLMDISLI